MSNALLFIPDISGFTKFVTQTAIEHSQFIIAKLLETTNYLDGFSLQLMITYFSDWETRPSLNHNFHKVIRHGRFLPFSILNTLKCLMCFSLFLFQNWVTRNMPFPNNETIFDNCWKRERISQFCLHATLCEKISHGIFRTYKFKMYYKNALSKVIQNSITVSVLHSCK